MAWIAHGDPGEIYDENNQLLPIKQMPLHVRATIAGIDHDKDTGRVVRIRFWDKNAALEKAMRHHGLYDRDNQQRRENLAIQVNLVGPPAQDERPAGRRRQQGIEAGDGEADPPSTPTRRSPSLTRRRRAGRPNDVASRRTRSWPVR